MAINQKYSYKSWGRQSFTGKDPTEFNDTEIVAAGFGQKEPLTKVFPDGMKGVTFRDCNLDNCIIPTGNTVIGGTNKHVKEQADGEMWIVDEELKPVSPMKPYRFDKMGLSKDPKDISTQAAIAGREIPGSTSLLCITVAKEQKFNKAMNELIHDFDKLKAILVSEGKV